MTIKEGLDKIGALIKTAFEAVPVPAALTATDYPLADGTTASIDKLEAGGTVTIAGAPAPDGELCLADGTKITVAGGLITAVTPAAAPAPAPQPEEMKTPAQMQAALEKFAEDNAANPDLQKTVIILKACFENVFGWQIREAQEKATRDAAIAAYKTGFAKQGEALTEIHKLLGEFAEASKEAPKETPANWEQMTALERRRFLKNQ